MPLVVENKIYSNEGQNQTKKYHDAVAQYLAKEKGTHAIEIYLTPDDTKHAVVNTLYILHTKLCLIR